MNKSVIYKVIIMRKMTSLCDESKDIKGYLQRMNKRLAVLWSKQERQSFIGAEMTIWKEVVILVNISRMVYEL